MEVLIGCIRKIYFLKVFAAEWVAIISKREMYKDIKLSAAQTDEINSFWIKNYGKPINLSWHKLYQSINGVLDEQYFPDNIFAAKLEPKLNPIEYCRFISDKSLTELLYGKISGVKFPQTIALNCSGYFYNRYRNIISKEVAWETLSNCGNVVIKPILGGSSGKSVQVLEISNGYINNTNKTIAEILEEYKENYIIQSRLSPNKQYAKLYNFAINTIRLITYVVKDEIHHAPLCLRIGTGGEKVDNIHAGGIVIGISDDGYLNEYGYKLGYCDSKVKFKAHPDSKLVFKGYHVPETLKMIDIAKQLHGRTPHIGMISWDFMVDEHDEIVLIEGNYYGQSIWFPQIVHGKAIFGNDTKDMLAMIKTGKR